MDIAKGKSFLQNVKNTYEIVGFKYEAVRRVWVCWAVNASLEELQKVLDDCCKENGLNPGMITVVSFRDVILKDLLQTIEGANYQDDALRTVSLVKQFLEHRAQA